LKEFFTGLFVLVSLLSFFILVAASYQTYHRSLEYAKMTDIACTLATQLCLRNRPAVIELENLPFEGIYELGGENFYYSLGILTIDGRKVDSNIPRAKCVELEVPVLVRGVPAKLKVMVWKGA